ncbi:hypothetical protein GCM10023203_22190 [Actinomycetospora straminea]|uniref:Uncharacterized protein n=2 Tax=Actinomycetospora straminea TaxID=663607 RepID=A0ABP9E9X0_9PSEU
MRATGLTTGGYHFCTACQGSGSCAQRTWTSRGWERSYGKCGACNGKGGKFANHAPKDRPSARVTRRGLGGRAR